MCIRDRGQAPSAPPPPLRLTPPPVSLVVAKMCIRDSGLSEALQVVDTDPSYLGRLGLTAHRSYEERFDPEVNFQQLLDIYRFAIEHPAVRAE